MMTDDIPKHNILCQLNENKSHYFVYKMATVTKIWRGYVLLIMFKWATREYESKQKRF